MKGKAIIPLALGLAVGLLAVKLLVDFVKKAQASGSERQTVSVVRAKQDIAELQEITTELVEVVETTENQFLPAADRISKLEEVVGRVAAKAIPQKLPVLKSLLAP
ncbi:MAG: hypothetical protein HY763_13005, partial [Planctomycetes bacterium]|nr:hypothetical protein [Planctomycetota bacterium]